MAKRGPRVLRSYHAPCYPTRTAVLAKPDLLQQYVPSAWLWRREIATAAGVLLSVTTLGTTSGCVFGAPAVVEAFSESSARQIIRDELGHRGVVAIVEEAALPGVTLASASGEAEPFVVDLSDPKWKWALEYVARDDLRRLEARLPAGTGDTDARLTARVAAQAPNVHFRALRAPNVPTGDVAKYQAKAENQLREQVKDFIDWLKAQGVI
jgi:hypothetical protein